MDRCKLKTNMGEINWLTDFYSLDFDCLFSAVDLKSFLHFIIHTIIDSLPWLLFEVCSTQSYHHYL